MDLTLKQPCTFINLEYKSDKVMSIIGIRAGDRKDVVVLLLQCHKESMLKRNGLCSMGYEHCLLYLALEYCYQWNLPDAGSDNGTREKISAFIYVVDKANAARLNFVINPWEAQNKYRLIDVPIGFVDSSLQTAISYGLPAHTYLLLRFGALPSKKYEMYSNVENLLNRLVQVGKPYPENLVYCLRLILRAIRSIKLQDFNSFKTMQHLLLKDFMLKKYGTLINDGIVPSSRCGFMPPGLKHLCRCEVRKTLWKNFQLPYGISKLGLPKYLQSYLNISED